MAERGGQPGNDNATKNRLFRETLDRAIKAEDGKRLRAAVEKLLDLAAAGEQWAAQMVADRLDGKPTQMIIGDADQPLTVVSRIERVIVKNTQD